MNLKHRYISCIHIIILLVCCNLASCIFDPKEVKPPTLEPPKQWAVQHKGIRMMPKKIAQENLEPLQCHAWWEGFQDPVLNQLIHAGRIQNNDLQIAVSNIEAAQGELKRVKWNWSPGLDSLFGYTSFPYLGYPGVIAVLLPTYTINVLKQIKEQDKAFHEVAISQNMRDTVELAVVAQIAASYFTLLGQTELLAYLQSVEKDWAEREAIQLARYNQGLNPQIRLSELRATLELVRAEEQVIQKNIIYAQNTLRYLINENPAPFTFNRTFQQLDAHQVLPAALPANILNNRPDMHQAMHHLKRANAEIGMAVSRFLPTADLMIARGDIGTVPYGKTLGQPVFFNQSLLESPLIHPSSFGAWDATKGKAKAAYYHFIDTFRKILKEVNNEIAAHDFYDDRLIKTHLAYKAQSKAFHLKEALYHKGIISYEALLREKTKLDEINLTVNRNKQDLLLSVVSLSENLALGYGCRPETLNRADIDTHWLLSKMPFRIPFYHRNRDNFEFPIIFKETA